MFSARTRFELRTNRLARLLDARRARGAPLLDLTEANPTRCALPYPEDLLAPLADPGALVYEPSPWGLLRAREAVAADFARRGFGVDPDRLLLTASTSEAYSFLFKLLCDPGDEVLVPRPGYPLFEYLAGLESAQVRPYPLEYDGEWRHDLAALEAAVTPRTRAIVLVNPGNPTGAFLKRSEAEPLFELAAARGLAIISDEVFADYAFGPDPRRLQSVAEDGPALSFALGGLSKSCGLPQLKLGWLAVFGPEPLREAARSRLEIVADSFLSVGTPVQRAAPALLARLPELQAPIHSRISRNRQRLRRLLGQGSPASLLAAEGGWYAVLRIPATLGEEERVLRLLATRDVLVHPGYFFDFQSEAHLVLSLLPEEDVFAAGVEGLLADLVL